MADTDRAGAAGGVRGDGTIRWQALRREAVARLGAAGVPSPEVDARLIVQEALGATPAELAAALGKPATVGGVARLDSMLARREDGEPLQYVLGRWGFRTLDLHVDPRVLVPRPETEVVAGIAIEAANEMATAGREVLVADLGTGSGGIALAVAAECPRARVIATDVSVDALAVARANLSGLGRPAVRVSLRSGHWFEGLPESLRGGIDVLVSNPPYVADGEPLPPEVTDWEPEVALRAGPDGTECLEHLVDGAVGWLAPRGVLVLELAPHQAEVIAERARRRGLSASVRQDLAGRQRAVVARRR
ncbi:MAG: peptide chain release factor N(5)-glutamine methyltransferase [Acidimicrobiales bacterium]